MERSVYINKIFDVLYHARVKEAELARHIGMHYSALNLIKRSGKATINSLEKISAGANRLLQEKGDPTRFSVEVVFTVNVNANGKDSDG